VRPLCNTYAQSAIQGSSRRAVVGPVGIEPTTGGL
jgi:hypothetical protein